jgi:tRNA threonylcarbamoyladenosine dehydratase
VSAEIERLGGCLSLASWIDAVLAPAVPHSESWRALVLQLAPGEWKRFEDFCRAQHITIIDRIEPQLLDLGAIRIPGGSADERQLFAAHLVATSGGRECFGNWINLPWESKVVHLLDRESYFDVITNRNRDKITRDQQRHLREKRIGVVGLSVGGEAAVTVAQEHLCGEIVLADFDGLDLSNLNRLHAGIDDLGSNKAVLVARRVAKIDPYLSVTIFQEGVTAANVDAFLQGLDLLIEESDGLQMKYELRRLAKARRINIVFAADERGFLSVEPYADFPNLAPFHGRLPGPQLPRSAYPSTLVFMRDLTEWLGGWDEIAEVSRRSVEQIGTSLCGYPQLASEARYAAGQIGNVARRLLLGEKIAPFCGHLDLEQVVPRARV